jgi:Protein of unknown function (DUF3775)
MPVAAEAEEKTAPELTIALEKVDYVIVKARQFDVKEGDSDPDEGSNPTDDGQADVLEDGGEDAVRQELVSFINAMDVDEKAELVALAWLGRGTYEIDEWQTALETAKTEHAKRTAQYLLDLPLLGDYLADGLAEFGEEYSENEVD